MTLVLLSEFLNLQEYISKNNNYLCSHENPEESSRTQISPHVKFSTSTLEELSSLACDIINNSISKTFSKEKWSGYKIIHFELKKYFNELMQTFNALQGQQSPFFNFKAHNPKNEILEFIENAFCQIHTFIAKYENQFDEMDQQELEHIKKSIHEVIKKKKTNERLIIRKFQELYEFYNALDKDCETIQLILFNKFIFFEELQKISFLFLKTHWDCYLQLKFCTIDSNLKSNTSINEQLYKIQHLPENLFINTIATQLQFQSVESKNIALLFQNQYLFVSQTLEKIITFKELDEFQGKSRTRKKLKLEKQFELIVKPLKLINQLFLVTKQFILLEKYFNELQTIKKYHLYYSIFWYQTRMGLIKNIISSADCMYMLEQRVEEYFTFCLEKLEFSYEKRSFVWEDLFEINRQIRESMTQFNNLGTAINELELELQKLNSDYDFSLNNLYPYIKKLFERRLNEFYLYHLHIFSEFLDNQTMCMNALEARSSELPGDSYERSNLYEKEIEDLVTLRLICTNELEIHKLMNKVEGDFHSNVVEKLEKIRKLVINLTNLCQYCLLEEYKIQESVSSDSSTFESSESDFDLNFEDVNYNGDSEDL